MKRVLLAVTAALALSACAEDLGYGPYYGGQMVYYDGYYGPFYNGYWGSSGVFIYSDDNHHFHRDEGRHFRRDNPGAGFHPERTHPGWAGHKGAPGAPSGGPHAGPQGGHRDHDGPR